MGTGIIICGLNGTGKSTLGKALAEKLNFYFVDIETLYFPNENPNYSYAFPRTREKVEQILLNEIKTHEDFIFASVRGDYGEIISSSFQYAVMINVPKDIRIQRVKNRSFQKYGDRILLGGDLYEKEEAFFNFVKSRTEDTVEEWLQSFSGTIIRIDGTKPIEENINLIIELIQN